MPVPLESFVACSVSSSQVVDLPVLLDEELHCTTEESSDLSFHDHASPKQGEVFRYEALLERDYVPPIFETQTLGDSLECCSFQHYSLLRTELEDMTETFALIKDEEILPNDLECPVASLVLFAVPPELSEIPLLLSFSCDLEFSPPERVSIATMDLELSSRLNMISMKMDENLPFAVAKESRHGEVFEEEIRCVLKNIPPAAQPLFDELSSLSKRVNWSEDDQFIQTAKSECQKLIYEGISPSFLSSCFVFFLFFFLIRWRERQFASLFCALFGTQNFSISIWRLARC